MSVGMLATQSCAQAPLRSLTQSIMSALDDMPTDRHSVEDDENMQEDEGEDVEMGQPIDDSSEEESDDEEEAARIREGFIVDEDEDEDDEEEQKERRRRKRRKKRHHSKF